jgi:hypothetical protein
MRPLRMARRPTAGWLARWEGGGVDTRAGGGEGRRGGCGATRLTDMRMVSATTSGATVNALANRIRAKVRRSIARKASRGTPSRPLMHSRPRSMASSSSGSRSIGGRSSSLGIVRRGPTVNLARATILPFTIRRSR